MALQRIQLRRQIDFYYKSDVTKELVLLTLLDKKNVSIECSSPRIEAKNRRFRRFRTVVDLVGAVFRFLIYSDSSLDSIHKFEISFGGGGVYKRSFVKIRCDHEKNIEKKSDTH